MRLLRDHRRLIKHGVEGGLSVRGLHAAGLDRRAA
jgi:hypothetical protein